jgi:hypothetical protein
MYHFPGIFSTFYRIKVMKDSHIEKYKKRINICLGFLRPDPSQTNACVIMLRRLKKAQQAPLFQYREARALILWLPLASAIVIL